MKKYLSKCSTRQEYKNYLCEICTNIETKSKNKNTIFWSYRVPFDPRVKIKFLDTSLDECRIIRAKNPENGLDPRESK